MPDKYHIPYTGTLTNAGTDSDLIEILPADDHPVRLLGFRIGQISEVGDTAEEGLRLTLRHMTATVTSGSGGSAVTPVINKTGARAASMAVECNNTTVATTSGTSTIVEEIAWNIRASPMEIWWTDEDLMRMALQGEALLIRCETTPADDMTICVTFFVEEL